MKKSIRFGLVGYKFMGRAHSNALARLPMFFDLPAPVEQAVLCGRDPEWVRDAADRLGWKEVETDYRKLCERADVDVIDITAPSNAHKDIALAAAANGKHIFCEKPMAMRDEEAWRIMKAVRANGVKLCVDLNRRMSPALQALKKRVYPTLQQTVTFLCGFTIQTYHLKN